MMTRKKSDFTLLEVMIGIAILAIASGALFWRMNQMVERRRFDSDGTRFRSMLVSTRSLAINMKMDFRLEMKEGKEGWSARIICREDPDLVYRLPHFSPMKVIFNQGAKEELSVDFFSSGFVGPKGQLTLSHGTQKIEFKFPQLFYRQDDAPLIPLHPSEIL
jgi:prepilin-type N-terminal cleavage/methylation domain-containing protein